MSFGSKKSSGDVKVSAPPRITQTDFTLPSGDRFTSRSKGRTQYFESFLNPQSQAVVDESLQGLQGLARELRAPDQDRLKQIAQRGQDFYDLQASGINAAYDDRLKQTQADLNKRFGGAYNATFGTDLIARLENERVGSLGGAMKESGLLAEDLVSADEASRMNRFALFEGFLNNLNAQATGVGSIGSQTLSAERNRATQLALQQAQLSRQGGGSSGGVDAARMAAIAAQVAQVAMMAL